MNKADIPDSFPVKLSGDGLSCCGTCTPLRVSVETCAVHNSSHSHMWWFKWELHKIKAPAPQKPHNGWLPSWTEQTQNPFALPIILLDILPA